jgi:hypothetical protein
MRGAGAILSLLVIFSSGITLSVRDSGTRAAGAAPPELDCVNVEPDAWLVTGSALGAKWLGGALAEGGALGSLCETLALDEELGAALAGALGAGAGLGAGAALGGVLGGGLLGALASWCCAKTVEDSSRTAARPRLESRIKHLVPTEPYESILTSSTKAGDALFFLDASTSNKSIRLSRVKERSN